MIISIEWLIKFVKIKESPVKLAELLSKAGLEAETTHVPFSIPGVEVARVENTRIHPNADKLKICEVNDGTESYQVICGAPNVEKGQVVAFAKIGTILPGDIKIKKANIRGEESYGMICSEKELNISEDHEGIMVLPNHLTIGDDFSTAYGYKFLSLQLDITPNRSDAFSHLGVARDIAAVTKRKLVYKPNKIPSFKKEYNFEVKLENEKDCPRYAGGILKNIHVGKSPSWLVDHMKSIGERSINNLVDISNYVTFELGHPTHLFDLDRLPENKILVRRAKQGEKIITLDAKQHKLNENNLLITSKDKPIALAGIMGGLNSAVTDKTKNIFIESAYFDPVTIRKSAKSLFLSTEASKRYERGVDPNGCINAFSRVVSLICKVTKGELSSEVIDEYPNQIISREVNLRRSEIDLVLGYYIEDEIISETLSFLEIEYTIKNNMWACIIPTFRPDIEREIDIIEEIARITGFDLIPSDENIYGAFKYKAPDSGDIFNKIRNSLSSCGFHQIYSNSLQNEKEAYASGINAIPMLNPLNTEMGFLRTSLIPGLIKSADFNVKNGAKSFRIYELGNVHHFMGEGLLNMIEFQFMSGLIFGERNETSVHYDSTPETIYDIKGLLSFLFSDRLNMNVRYRNGKNYAMDQAQTILVNNQDIGQYGRISEFFLRDFGYYFPRSIYGFEINFKPIKKMMGKNKIFKKINLYPTIDRDLNFVLKHDQPVGEVLDAIRRVGNHLIKEAYPKNIYFDPVTLGEGVKSVTFSLVFQHSSKTLEDSDVNPIIDEIVNFAEKNFYAKLRI